MRDRIDETLQDNQLMTRTRSFQEAARAALYEPHDGISTQRLLRRASVGCRQSLYRSRGDG